jgi:hypothetical protein
MVASDDLVFAMAIAKCILIVSCAFGTIVCLAWAGGKRMFSDQDSSASHFKQKTRLKPHHVQAQHSLRSGIAIFQQHIRR